MQLASQRPGRAPEDALHNRRCCLRFKDAVHKNEYSGRVSAGTRCTLTCGQLICDCGRLLGIRGTGKGRLLVEDTDRDEPTPTRLDLKPKPVRLLLPRELTPSGVRAIGLCFCASRVSTLCKNSAGTLTAQEMTNGIHSPSHAHRRSNFAKCSSCNRVSPCRIRALLNWMNAFARNIVESVSRAPAKR